LNIVLLISSLLAVGFLALEYGLYRTAFGRDARRQAAPDEIPPAEGYQRWKEPTLHNIRRIQAQPLERVSVTARDGTPLCGRLSPGEPGAPVALMFHGYRSDALRDASGGYWVFREHGFRVLLADERAHGESGGRSITFGVRERYDVLDWIGYVRRRFGEETPVLLLGVSMGAATVLMTAGLSLPENVRGIIADSPYSSPAAILRKVIREDMRLPDRLCYPLVRLSARLFGGFDPDAASALEAVRQAEVPILLIHGEADAFVPTEMSRELAAASPRTRLLTVPEADHAMSFYEGNTAWTAAVDRLIRDAGL